MDLAGVDELDGVVDEWPPVFLEGFCAALL